MRRAGGVGEGGGHDNQVGRAGSGQAAIQLGEAQVVADRQAHPQRLVAERRLEATRARVRPRSCAIRRSARRPSGSRTGGSCRSARPPTRRARTPASCCGCGPSRRRRRRAAACRRSARRRAGAPSRRGTRWIGPCRASRATVDLVGVAATHQAEVLGQRDQLRAPRRRLGDQAPGGVEVAPPPTASTPSGWRRCASDRSGRIRSWGVFGGLRGTTAVTWPLLSIW